MADLSKVMAKQDEGFNRIIFLFLFLFFWLTAGYRFFVNAGIETVPLIERALSPAYLPNDYYLNLISDTVHHRYVYVLLLNSLARILGGVESAMLVAYIAFYLVLFHRLVALSAWFSTSGWVRLAALCVTTAFVYYAVSRLNPGAVVVLPNETISNLFARTILVAGLVAAMTGRSSVAMALLVLAAFFHPLEALLSYPFIACLSVVASTSAWKTTLARVGFWFLPLAAVVLAMSSGTLTSGADPEIVRRAFEQRLGHHYIPSAWPWWNWVFLAVIGICGSISLRARGMNGLLAAGLVALGLFLGYIAALQLLGENLLLSLQGAKVLMLPYLVWSLSLSVDLVIVLGHFIRALRWRGVRSGLMLLFVAGAAVGGVVGAKTYLPPGAWVHIDRQVRSTLSGNYRTAADYVDRDEAALYRWIAANTTADEVILHPPELQMIRPLAQRSSVVQNKLIGFTEPAMREWLARILRLQGYCGLRLAALRDIAVHYRAGWIVVPTGCAGADPSQTVFANTRWNVLPTTTR